MARILRVGIIGVNADRGWAREAHAPAVIATDGLELAAVATRSQDSADAAAHLFGVHKAYGDAASLIHDPEIDVVAVVSTVPTHRELILDALSAGKHVITEWPLAVGSPATEEIADAAARAGLHTAIGLQARANPSVLRARRLLEDGRIGAVRTVRVLATTAAFGGVIDPSAVSLEDEATGMNLTTIQTAHALDLVAVLGLPLASLSALRTVQFPRVSVSGTGQALERTLPDHVMVLGAGAPSGTAIVEVIGGRPADETPFRLEIEGDAGVMVLTGGAPRGFQSGLLTLTLNGQAVPVETPDLPAPVVNVAGIYSLFRDDIVNDTTTAPTFGDAVGVSHLVDDVIRSDRTGSRVVTSAPWPSR